MKADRALADQRTALAKIKRFDQLIAYLRDELGWPISRDSFENDDDLFFDFTPEELGIDPSTAAKIEEIKRLRPLVAQQPWGIFFIKFEPKRLPVVALRRILSRVALKRRASANSDERAAWSADDILFISNFGQDDHRQISFANFSQGDSKHDRPVLKVLGWDNRDTPLHLDDVAQQLAENLAWPADDSNVDAWRQKWSSAFSVGNREVVATSRDLSIRLAELARAIRDRIQSALSIETKNGPLTKLMRAFQETLIHDLDADGFADMYAQTIAYGLLSARITDPNAHISGHLSAHMRTNPFLKELVETFLDVGGSGRSSRADIDFDELGLSEVVEMLDAANMDAVVRDFGDRNPQEDPVIHFYELFLKEYDARERIQRGVFYTPKPVVSNIVSSADEVLRTEFGLKDGLADITTWEDMAKRHPELRIPKGIDPSQSFVQILDPATGTGTFLVEVIELIYQRMVANWRSRNYGGSELTALWNDYVAEHLLPRLHGYELLMAPYAIAHLKIGLKLFETGYRFRNNERVRVYLTNSLEPPTDFSGRLAFAIPALAHEVQAVNEVKRNQRFTVFIGNPPYSKISANMDPWAQDLVKNSRVDNLDLPSFYEVDGQPLGERKVNLQDDYIKFLRLGQYNAARTGSLVLGMITNRGYLSGPTFRGMRQSLLHTFQQIEVTDLHGDSNVGERAPDGSANENVFDIQQGVAITMMTASAIAKPYFAFRDLWGTRNQKYSRLMVAWNGGRPQRSLPQSPYYLFSALVKPRDVVYANWLNIAQVFPNGASGIVTSRDALVIGETDREIITRINEFLDTRLDDEEVAAKFHLTENYAWRIGEARRSLRKDPKWQSKIADILYRPFDSRRILYHRAVVWRTREPLMSVLQKKGNLGLVATRQSLDEFSHAFITRSMIEYKAGSHHRNSQVFPLHVTGDMHLLHACLGRGANLSSLFIARLASAMGLDIGPSGLPDGVDPQNVLEYVYAVLHSPDYRERYAEFMKVDFPHIPIPGSPDLFWRLAQKGGELIGLHLLESAQLDDKRTDRYVGPKNPEVIRIDWADDAVWLDAVRRKKDGDTLPGSIGFRGVSERVWNFHIGGYQVCEKWLKDRRGQALSSRDITHYEKIVVAITETLRLMEDIDSIIERHGGWPSAFAQE
jgi:predicted helicase